MQYINVQPFMIRDLHLSGNSLLIYAAIHGFSTHQKCFYGSFQYLADMICTTVDEVKSIIDKLVSDGLLLKKESTWKGVVHQMYQTAKKAIAHIKDSVAPQKADNAPVQKDRSREAQKSDKPSKPVAYGHLRKHTTPKTTTKEVQGESVPISKEKNEHSCVKTSTSHAVNSRFINTITDISKEKTTKDYDEDETEKLRKQMFGKWGLLPKRENQDGSAPMSN